jgi:alkanesulfonate monooxygenase SsuD/methylene tetrahydromethanopterin reductase-like flavin-dependent oxidoreductase (luciferase family)
VESGHVGIRRARSHRQLRVSTPVSAERPARIGASIVTNASAAAACVLFKRYATLRQAAGALGEPKLGIARHIVVADTDKAALTIARPAYRRWHASFLKLWLDHGTRPIGVVYPVEFDGEGHDGCMIAGSTATVRDVLQTQSTNAARIMCWRGLHSATSRSPTRSARSRCSPSR